MVISARTEDQLAEVAREVEAAGRRAVVVPADLSDLDAAAGLAAAAVEAFGRLDIVVNNVGGAMPRPFLDTTPRHLADAFQFNVATAHSLTQAAVPHLLASSADGAVRGHNISSAVGRVAGRGYLAYGTAKAALAHYTRLAAADLAPRIRVNAIAVGSVATSALDIVLTDDELRGQMERATPLGRIGDPDDIAAAVVFLASPGRRLRHRQDPRGRRRPRPAQPRSGNPGPLSRPVPASTSSPCVSLELTSSALGDPE